jgi:hypothetical protein
VTGPGGRGEICGVVEDAKVVEAAVFRVMRAAEEGGRVVDAAEELDEDEAAD